MPLILVKTALENIGNAFAMHINLESPVSINAQIEMFSTNQVDH